MVQNETEWHRIENWIEQKHSFVLYREPQQSICHCLMQRSAVKQFTHISQLNGVRGYVFAPFRTDALSSDSLIRSRGAMLLYMENRTRYTGGIYAEEPPECVLIRLALHALFMRCAEKPSESLCCRARH